MAAVIPDVFRHIASREMVVQSTGGASESTTSLSAQTYFVRLCATAAVSSVAGTAGVRYVVGDAVAGLAATGSSALLPVNWVEIVKVTPGQKVAALSNNGNAATLSIVELAH